jgi:hypothetical protein
MADESSETLLSVMKRYARAAAARGRRKPILLLLIVAALTGCGPEEGGVRGAKGGTPVKYVICGVGETNCFVSARFKDLDSCHSHKGWSEMLCDSQSKPGEMHCRKDLGPSIGVAYCTL